MLNPALTSELTIINRKGLHARAAAKVVKLCGQFQCEITFCRNDLCAAGRSILDLLMLAAAQGKQVKVTCQGDDAQAALEAITTLIGNGFDEEDCCCEGQEDHCPTPDGRACDDR